MKPSKEQSSSEEKPSFYLVRAVGKAMAEQIKREDVNKVQAPWYADCRVMEQLGY